jgi:hypothetical protein
MASLIEIGLESEQASATVEKFEFLDDEAFEAMSALLAAKMPPWLQKKKDEENKDEDKKEKKEASEAAVPDPAVLDTAEVDNGVNLSIGSDEESSIEATRAALVEFVTNRLSLKS